MFFPINVNRHAGSMGCYTFTVVVNSDGDKSRFYDKYS